MFTLHTSKYPLQSDQNIDITVLLLAPFDEFDYTTQNPSDDYQTDHLTCNDEICQNTLCLV